MFKIQKPFGRLKLNLLLFFRDVMEDVAHLHRKGIRHLNITPENILLFGDGKSDLTAKLANFTFHKSVDHVFSGKCFGIYIFFFSKPSSLSYYISPKLY
jgi:serine/threonine protein kinase